MKLKGDENLIMDNGPLGLKKKLTLTNKRLIIQKDEGLFNVNWKQEKVIFLDSIDDIYLETKDFSGLSSMKIKMKEGKTIELSLLLSDSWLVYNSSESKLDEDKSKQLKILNLRWVGAITNQLMRNHKKKTEVFLRKCPKCEKKITQKNFKYCPFCGRMLKSKYIF